MKILSNHAVIVFIALLLVISLFSSVILFKQVEKTRFNGDESGWISSGYYYANLVLTWDFEWQKWKCPQCESWGSWLNLHVGQYLMGIPLKMFATKEDQEFFGFYRHYHELQSDESLRKNEVEGRVPPRDILLRARRISAVFGVLCCLIVLTISYYSANLWIGLMAVILLLANKLFLVNATQAMTDVYYNFFLLCIWLVSIFLLKLRKKGHILIVSSFFGIFVGFATSVKITGLVVGGLFFLSLAVYKHILCKLKMIDIVSYVAVFVVSAIAIIYLLNPYFWPSYTQLNGKGIVRELGALYKEVTSGKAQEGKIRERYPQLSNLSHLVEFPYLFLRWNEVMNRQLKEWKSASWQGNRWRAFHESLFIRHSGFPLEWIFFCIGIIFHGAKIFSSFRDRKLILSNVSFLYFVVNYVFILLFMKLNWGRYYLPTVIASQMIVAAGMYEVVTQAYRYCCQRKQPEQQVQ